MSRTNRRRFALPVLMLLLSVSILAQAPAAPEAGAAVHNLFPADADGFPKGHFFSDEALYVTLTSDFYGGVVCIVDAEITVAGSADCVKDNAWGKPRTFTGLGTMLGFPLKAPWLTAGEWRLLSVPALTADGKPVPGTELSEVFEVEACGPCDRSWADDELQPWKNMAGTMKTLGDLTKAADAYDAASKVNDVAKSMYTGAAFGLSGILFGGLAGGAALALDSMGAKSTESMAKDLFKGLAGRVGSMYADIYADPPRFDYDVATVPQFQAVEPLLPDASMSAAQIEVANAYFDAMARAAAYGDASRIANERYQGAVIDGDHQAAHDQALAASTFTFNMNQQLALVQLYEPQVMTQGWATEKNVTVPAGETWAGMLAEIDELRTNGLTPAQQAALDAELASCTITTLAGDCLITQELVDQALVSWQDPAWFASLEAVDPNGSLAEVFAVNSGRLDDAIAAFEHFGQWMAHNASYEHDQIIVTPPNRAPVSAFDASALTGTAPLTVTFTSAATDADGDALALTWDIAGTRRVDNENTVTHTFTTPGTYGVSLVATDPSGEWDQAIKWITVYPGTGLPPGDNQAPVASFSPQWVDRVGPFTQTFTASSFDPDGDPITHTWYFGDGTTATGKSVTKTFPPGFIMSVLLVASDGTLTGQVAGEVTSRHPGVDPDPNAPPVASFDADPSSGNSPLEVSFTSTSTDPDGDALDHTWYFGDGATATGATATHTYTEAGTYTATLVVSDGTNSASATRQIVVHATTPIKAAYTVGKSIDVAAAANGGRILDTGVSQWAGYPVTNLITPSTNHWYSANGVTSPQEIVFDLGGRGRDLIDRIALQGLNATTSVKTFTVALVAGEDPNGPATTVIDHATLERNANDQTFTFAEQQARFVKLTVHDNHGGAYLRLAKVSVPTVGTTGTGTGGIVSLDSGNPATIVSATSEYNTNWAASNILSDSTAQWSSAYSQVTDQRIRVRLGGDGPHELSTIVLRSSGNSYTVGDFEVYASLTGDDGSWTKILDDTMAANNAAQSFPLATPTDAAYLELRLNGSGNYLYLAELRALTAHGLNVADGSGVGAQVADVSSVYAGYFASSAIAPDSNTAAWLSANGQVTDQYLTVLLRNGDVATVDRVSVRSTNQRPRNVKVQTSLDGVSFTTVAVRQLLNVSDEHVITFAPVATRFVRLVVDDGYGASYIRVDKFRVYAADRGAAADVQFVDLSTGTKPPVSWLWDFGDGTTSTDQHPTHTFGGPGTYPITLTVTDEDGATDTTAGSYTVPGVPPTSLGATVATEESDGTFTIGEGTNTNLTATATGTPAVAWEWDLDYTKPSTTAATITAKFPDQGTYTVRYRGLTADWVWTPWVERTFVVHNLPPVVDAGSPATVFTLNPVTPLATISDPAGAADPLTCTWDWGDGTPDTLITACTTAKARVPHTYAVEGIYDATLTVDDGDGGVTTDVVEITVQRRPVIVQIHRASATASDLEVTARLHDALDGEPLEGNELSIAAGSASAQGTTGADGAASVSLSGQAAAAEVTVTFAGDERRAPATVTRPVRAPKADIVFLVDESASMSSYQATMIDRMQNLVRGLGASLDFRVGTVGYAAGTRSGFGEVYGPLTDDLGAVYDGLDKLIISSASANGYEAVVKGMGFEYVDGELVENNVIGQRPNAASCAVLISDAAVSEADGLIASSATNVPKADYAAALDALQRRDGTLFSIITTDQATKDAYGLGPGLAGKTGGDAWSIADFNREPLNVLDALATKCITKASTPDLAVTLDGPTTPVAPGDEVTYTVTASNEAAIDTPFVTYSVTLPGDVEYLYSAGGGIYDAGTRTVTWPTVDLAAGASVARDVTVRVRSHEWTAGDHPITASAKVAYNGSLGAESDLANNTATHSSTVRVDEPIGPSTTTSSTTTSSSTTTTPTTTSSTTTTTSSTTTTMAPTTVPATTASPSTTVPPVTVVPPTDPPSTSIAPATTAPATTGPTTGPPTTAMPSTSRPDPTTTPHVPTPTGQTPPDGPAAVVRDETHARADRVMGTDDRTLARTGPAFPVPLAVGVSWSLVLVGAAVVLAARRRRPGAGHR